MNLPPSLKNKGNNEKKENGQGLTPEKKREIDYVIKHGKKPKKKLNTDGEANFNLIISRQVLYDIGVICTNHFPPKNDREREKSKASFIIESMENIIKKYKKKFPKYWVSIDSGDGKHLDKGVTEGAE